MRKLITLTITLLLLITPTFASFNLDSCINENYIKPESNVQYKAIFSDYKLVELNGLNTTVLCLEVVEGDIKGQIYEIEFWIEQDEISMFIDSDTVYYFEFEEAGELGAMALVKYYGDLEILLEDY